MRKDREYLPKLLEYIDFANKVPDDYKFPNWFDLIDSTHNYVKKETVDTKDVVTYLQFVFKDLPIDLQEYIFSEIEIEKLDSEVGSWDRIEVIKDRIELLSSIKYGLSNLAFFVNQEYLARLENLEMDLAEYVRYFNSDLPERIADLSVKIIVGNDGFIKLKSTEFYDLLTKYKIEARRIRLCLVCNKVFWATRVDKWTCSQTCGNILRQRNWQQQNKDEYNEKRRRNYAYKKSINKPKESK